MQLLPGKSIFSPAKPKMPPPPPAPVQRDDPSVTDARERLRQSELQRRGRAATILTGQLDDEVTLGRPRAGSGSGGLG